MYKMRLACETAKLFDPFFIKMVEINVLETLVDNIGTAFGYPEFEDPEFRELLKLELPSAVVDSQHQFNWEKAYDCRLS
jgi:hypothetical protein